MDIAPWYPWIKAIHIIFVIFWMAGLFMLPRYFAYHAECAPGSEEDARWQLRERKISGIILMPAMTVSWIMGLLLAWIVGAFSQGWFHGKLTLVVALTAYQFLLVRWRKDFERGHWRSTRFYRIVNEVPGVTIIAVVLLVVLKPF